MINKIKFLSIVFLLSIVLLFAAFPKPAHAFIGTGLFDYFTSSLEGIEEFSAPSTQLFLIIGLLLLITSLVLGLSASLLQWIITVPINLNNTLVLTGWNFTLGIVNIFFILIAVIIALAFILKIETIAQKKVLVNLILIALLVNFSMLFVGMLADVATFFQNTILSGMGDLVNDSIRALYGGANSMLNTLVTWLVGFLVLYALPFSAPFAQVAVALRSLTIVLMAPSLLGWLMTIFFGMTLAGFFFLYFFLFAVRIYVIWALAIFAPLAFICAIMPQTRKWWDEWLKHLFEWVSLGIVLLLWLVLGLKLIGLLVPSGGPTLSLLDFYKGEQWSFFNYYIFLVVYLAIGIYVEQKFAPMLAATLISTGQQLGGAVWTKGIKPLHKATTEAARQIPQISRAEEKIRRGLEERGLRPLGEYKMEKKKRRETAEKRLENLSDDELHNAVEKPRVGNMDKAAALNVLAKRGKVNRNDLREVNKFIPFGADKNMLLSRRPDRAPDFIDPTTGHPMNVAQVMTEMDPEDFRKNVQKEALQDRDVIYNLMLDETKFKEMEEKGKREKKREIKETYLNDPSLIIANFPAADRPFVNARAMKMINHPRWQV